MKFNILKRAFSLTELLIVLVIVAVLFAAMLPLFTKRNRGETTANEPVWMFVKDDPEKSAFYDPGSSGITSTAYVGVKPKYLTANALPYSKMVLRAKPLQNMIQFRVGNDGNGTLAGVFTATPSNMIIASKMQGDSANNFNSLIMDGENSTIAGMNTASRMTSAHGATIVGAMSSLGGNEDSDLVNLVALGANSNTYSKTKYSTLVGANTGNADTTEISNTVAVGAQVLGLPTSSGSANVLVGYNVGSIGMNASSTGNVILNSSYYGISPKYSTIIGYKAFEGGSQYAQNLTAIGQNSCVSFSNAAKGSKTCIGNESAKNYGAENATKDFGWEEDPYDHLFIGGKPNANFPGRSILEIHNIPISNKNTAYPKNITPTVVLNSHLVVRGNLYVPNSVNGQVGAFSYVPVQSAKSDTEKGKAECKRCFWRRKGWRSKDCSSWWKVILGALLMVGAILGAIFTGGATLATIPAILTGLGIGGSWVGGGALLGSGIVDMFTGDKWDRVKDQASLSGLGIVYAEANKQNVSFPCSQQYAPYFNGKVQIKSGSSLNTIDQKYCPNVLRTSDIRLKENISENAFAISKILQVNPYFYTYKNDAANKLHVGVMAQDLEKYFISAVSADLNGYKNIRWDEMFFATINSVKSLDDSVNKLNSEIVIMESDISNIKDQHKAIKDRIRSIDARVKHLENN